VFFNLGRAIQKASSRRKETPLPPPSPILLFKIYFLILGAMMSVMEEEMKREQLRRQYEEGRKYVINSALTW
jgi:hypothetical protein